MFKTLLAAGAFLLAPISVHAAECQFPFEATLHSFATSGAPWKIIPEDLLPKFEKIGEIALKRQLTVSRGFIVVVDGKILMALEADGCLLPPVSIGTVADDPEPPLSGRDKAGNVGA